MSFYFQTITKKNTNSYHCSNHTGYVPVNLFDSFAWELAKRSRKYKLNQGYIYDEELKKLQDSYSILLDKRSRAEQELLSLNKKKDKLAVLILNDSISQELFEKKSQELKSELIKAKKEFDRLDNSLNEASKRIENINQRNEESPLDLDAIEDDTERTRIIHEELYSIVVMEKAERSHEVKVGVSYNSLLSDLDNELDSSKIEFYELNTKTNVIVDGSGNKFEYTYYKRYSRTDRAKEIGKKADKKYKSTHKEKIAAYAREYRARKKAEKLALGASDSKNS